MLVLVFYFQGLNAFSQTLMQGHVSDEQGIPLQGVSLILKGKKTGAQTDAQGTFQIHAMAGDILIFSSVGYLNPQNIK